MFAFDNNNNNVNTIINYYQTITDTGLLTELIGGLSNDFYNFYNAQTQINEDIYNDIYLTWSGLYNQINNTYNNLAWQTHVLNSRLINVENWDLIINNQFNYYKTVFKTNIENIIEGLEDLFITGTYTRDLNIPYTYVNTDDGKTYTAYDTTYTYFSSINTSIYPFHDTGTKSGLAWKTDIPTFPDTNEFLLSTAYDDIISQLTNATSGLNYSMWTIYSNITYNTYTRDIAISNSISSISKAITQHASSILLISNNIKVMSSNFNQSITNYYNSAITKINATYSNITNIINSFSSNVNSSINNLSTSINDIFESIISINFQLNNNTLTPLITQLTTCQAITTGPIITKSTSTDYNGYVSDFIAGHFGEKGVGLYNMLSPWGNVYQWLFGRFRWSKALSYTGSADYIYNWKSSYWWEVVNPNLACDERMTLSPFAMRYHTILTSSTHNLTTILGWIPYTAQCVAEKTRKIDNFRSHIYVYREYPPSSRNSQFEGWVCDKKLLVSAHQTTSNDNTYTSFLEYRPYMLTNNFITSLYVIDPYNSPNSTTDNFYADMQIDNLKLKQLDVLYDNSFILGWADNWSSFCVSGESVFIPINKFDNLETFRLHVMNDEEFDFRGLHDTFNIVVKQNTNLKYFDFKLGPTFQTQTMSFRIIDSQRERVNFPWMFPNLETLIFYPNLFYSGLPSGPMDTLTSVIYEDVFYYIRDFTKLKHIELGLFDDWFRLPTKSTRTDQVRMTCSPSYIKIEGYAPHYSNWKFPSFSNTNDENITVDLSNFQWRYYYDQSTLIHKTTFSNRPPEPEQLNQLIPLFKTGTIHILFNQHMYKYLRTKINQIVSRRWPSDQERTRYKFYGY